MEDQYKVHGDRCRGNFLYNSVPVLATNSSSPTGNFVIKSSSSNGHQIMAVNTNLGAGDSNYFPPSDQVVKVEPPTTASQSQIQVHDFHYHLLREFQISGGANSNHNNNNDNVDSIKARILSHSLFSNLLQAFLDCQNVGAPPEVAAKLTSVREEFEQRRRSSIASSGGSSIDPELDQFMEAYYGMLVKYREEIARPIQEAADFMQRIEYQLNTLCNGSFQILASEGKCEVGMGSSEEEEEKGGEGEREIEDQIDPRAEERELKNHLLKKYSGYLSNLKQELSKKKKKGKLPKDARQELLRWWELHNKWPYPSEAEKLALAESTGLDQKQINNWFINQRKRHWKPSEDVQFMGMEGFYHPNAAAAAAAAFYFDGHFMGDTHYRLGP